MSNFEQWYEQEIGSENKPEYEAARWAWEYQQKKLDCCREENKAHLEKINELQSRVDGAIKILDGMRHNGAYRAIDILKGNKDE